MDNSLLKKIRYKTKIIINLFLLIIAIIFFIYAILKKNEHQGYWNEYPDIDLHFSEKGAFFSKNAPDFSEGSDENRLKMAQLGNTIKALEENKEYVTSNESYTIYNSDKKILFNAFLKGNDYFVFYDKNMSPNGILPHFRVIYQNKPYTLSYSETKSSGLIQIKIDHDKISFIEK